MFTRTEEQTEKIATDAAGCPKTNDTSTNQTRKLSEKNFSFKQIFMKLQNFSLGSKPLHEVSLN